MKRMTASLKSAIQSFHFVWATLVVVVFICSAGEVTGQVQQAWVVRYDNGITNGQHEALKMAFGSQGDIYVCGFSQDGNSNLDYVVLKYASNGVLRWASRFGSPTVSQARPTGFVVDAGDNAVVTGNAGTVKFADVGGEAWVEPYAGLSVAVDSNQNVFVTGVGTNFDTVKLNPAGSLLWRAQLADIGPTIGQVVRVDSLGNAYIAGSDAYFPLESGGKILRFYYQLLTAKFSPEGVLLWKVGAAQGGSAPGVQVQDAATDPAGSFYTMADFGDPGESFCTFKYSANGTPLWSSQPDPGTGPGNALAVDANLNVFLAGQDLYQYTGVFYFYYTCYKLNSSGVTMITNHYPQPPNGSSEATAVAVSSANNAYITGTSTGANSGNDIATIAYNNAGQQLWLQRYDGPGHGDDEGNAIAVDAQGNVYVAGYDTPVGGGTEMVLIKYSSVTAKHEANGSFQLEAQGAANEPFDVRASTNLADWLDLGTYGADTNGVLLFTDTNAGLFPQRFYVAKPE